jgi:5'-nucleotidase/UDP-sugar diphosphatase
MGAAAQTGTRKSYRPALFLGMLLLLGGGYLIYRLLNFSEAALAVGLYDNKVTLINTADIHGHLMYEEANGGYYTLDEVNIQMGMPLMKGIADEIRAKNPGALFLDSGDLFHGTNEANINKAQGIVEAANLMGFDAMAAGNHDFDFGFDRILQIRKELNYPILSANVYYQGKPAFQASMIKEVNGLKIGIFGLTVPESMSNLSVFGPTEVTFEDPTEIARKVVADLKAQNVNAIVLVSHLGDDLDRKLVQKVSGIDVVLCGHHHWLYKKAAKVAGARLVEAGSYSTHVGQADMYFKDGKLVSMNWEVHQTSDRSKEDPALAAVAKKYYAIAFEQGKKIVGEAAVQLDGIRSHVRTQETNLANLITDAMLEEGKADLALLNGGGIRESINQGTIRMYDVGKPLPFVNSLMTVDVKGEKVYDAIERGLREWPFGASNGGFLHVAGASYVFDGSKPAGKRLVSITKDGKPLEKDKVYKVAVNDYLAEGGDNFEEFLEGAQKSKGALLKDVLAKYIEKHKVVQPKLEGRITVINKRFS